MRMFAFLLLLLPACLSSTPATPAKPSPPAAEAPPPVEESLEGLGTVTWLSGGAIPGERGHVRVGAGVGEWVGRFEAACSSCRRMSVHVEIEVVTTQRPPPLQVILYDDATGKPLERDDGCFEDMLEKGAARCTIHVGTGWDGPGRRTFRLRLESRSAHPVDARVSAGALDPMEAH